MNDYLDYLQHHGIKGQKWGVRRFQNPDGSLTEAGKRLNAVKDFSRNTLVGNKKVRKEAKAAEKLAKKVGKEEGLSAKERRKAARNARGEVLVKNNRSYATAAAGAAAGIAAAMIARKAAGKMIVKSGLNFAGKSMMNAQGMLNNMVSGKDVIDNLAIDSIKLGVAASTAGALAIGSTVAATKNTVRKAKEARDIYSYNKNRR